MTPTTKYEPRSIKDASRGYQISADGTVRKWNRLVPVTKDLAGLPTVTIDGHARLIDEIVAWAFIGPPPRPIKAMTVTHFDGDMLNCAATNLAWRVHPDWEARMSYLNTLKSMPLVIPRRLQSNRPSRRILYFGAYLKPLPLRALDLSRHGKNVVMRLVTDEGTVDVSLPRTHAARMGTALTEYAQ